MTFMRPKSLIVQHSFVHIIIIIIEAGLLRIYTSEQWQPQTIPVTTSFSQINPIKIKCSRVKNRQNFVAVAAVLAGPNVSAQTFH